MSLSLFVQSDSAAPLKQRRPTADLSLDEGSPITQPAGVMTVAMTMLGFFGLTLVPLAITFVVGLMLPRWASYVPAAICVGFFVCIWGVATSRGGGDGDEAFLFYGGIYGAALLIAGAFGRLARAAGDSNADA